MRTLHSQAPRLERGQALRLIRWTLLWVGLGVGCAHGTSEVGTKTMRLELELTRSELFVQETTEAKIVFENRGSSPVQVPHPESPGDRVKLEVTDESNGKTTVHDSMAQTLRFDPHYLPSPDGPLSVELSSKGKSAIELSLLQWIGTLGPGSYRLRAVFVEGDERHESAAVDLTVKQGPPIRTVLTPPSSPLIPQWHAIEARGNSGSEVDLLLQTWSFAPCAMVKRSVRIGSVPSYRSAAASVMPSKMWDQGHWVAWVDDKKLMSSYVSEEGEAGKPRSFALPDGSSDLLSPLFHATALKQPPGEWSALLIQSSRDLRVAALGLEFHTSGKVSADHGIPLGEGQLKWGQTAYTSTGDRRAAVVIQRGNSVQLRSIEWKKGEPPTSEVGELEWNGTFLDSSLALADDGSVRGVTALLAREGEGDNAGPKVVHWTISTTGELEVTETVDIEWSPGRGMTEARLAIDRAGAVVGLVCDQEGLWQLFDGTPELARSPLQTTGGQPMDIFFPRTGLSLVRFDDGVGRTHFFTTSGEAYPSW